VIYKITDYSIVKVYLTQVIEINPVFRITLVSSHHNYNAKQLKVKYIVFKNKSTRSCHSLQFSFSHSYFHVNLKTEQFKVIVIIFL